MPISADPQKIRSVFLIDGFNLYHAIDAVPHFHGFKWLNPIKLARAYAPKEALIAVFFFTALPPWNEQKRARHQRLLEIYEDLGVIVVRGMFKHTTATCRLCGQTYSTYDEKLTDINICLELLRMGSDDLADRIYLVTGDNDQAASVRRFRGLYPDKEVVAVIPPFRRAAELQQAATADRGMTMVQLQKAVLDNPFKFKSSKVYVKPDNWTAKPTPDNWTPPCSHS
ncbi:MAG: NYN domain-containing protein [Opitutaceae bacterium]|nr:NYN domain-containing protein [Opitutaceae bacterium]